MSEKRCFSNRNPKHEICPIVQHSCWIRSNLYFVHIVTRKSSCGKPQEAYRPWHNLSKHILSRGRGRLTTLAGGGVPTLARGKGYLPWLWGSGYLPWLWGSGYLPWLGGGGTYLDWGEGVPTLAGRRGTYLVQDGVPPPQC